MSVISGSKEEWRPVVGWEETYEVSNLGKVRSHSKGRHHGIILAGRGGSVGLREQGRHGFFNISYLVATAFHGEPPGETGRGKGEYHVVHKDQDRTNNDAENLQWVINLDEEVFAWENGHLTPFEGSRRTTKLSRQDISEIQVRLSKNDSVTRIAEDYGVARSSIYSIKNKGDKPVMRTNRRNLEGRISASQQHYKNILQDLLEMIPNEIAAVESSELADQEEDTFEPSSEIESTLLEVVRAGNRLKALLEVEE